MVDSLLLGGGLEGCDLRAAVGFLLLVKVGLRFEGGVMIFE